MAFEPVRPSNRLGQVTTPAAAPLSPAEEAAWRAFARAVLVIPRVLDGELLETEGLNLAEYTVLMVLSEQPDRSMRMSDLASAAAITVSGLTRLVNRLGQQGLVERVRCATDGRGQLAVLTPAGLGRLENAYRTHLAGVREHVMDHLTSLDLPTFTEAVGRVAAAQVASPARRVQPSSTREPS